MCKGDKSKNDETAQKCNKNVTNQIQKTKFTMIVIKTYLKSMNWSVSLV